MTERLVIANAEVDGRLVHVAVEQGRVTSVGPNLPGGASEWIEAGGGALLPGLHDHHIHLLAAAAARESLDVTGTPSFADALRAAAGDGWLRVVGYHESMVEPLDRWVLDRLAPGRPVRVQHRSGMLWVLSSAALGHLDAPLPSGAGRRADGEPDGRFVREDEWLLAHLPGQERPSMAPVFDSLRRCGVTGVTDLTPFTAVASLAVLAEAAAGSGIEVTATGAPDLTAAAFPAPLRRGPVKVLVDEAAPPAFDDLTGWIAAAHRNGRAVAVHCVTRAVLALVVAAFDAAGSRPGDRVEHGAVVPPEYLAPLRALGLTVVTQPGFVRTRGEQYRRSVEGADLPHLWPCGSLLAGGVRVGGGSDAPFGPLDPWLAIDTAVTRMTEAGTPLGPHEAIDPHAALAMWLTPAGDPGGSPRRVAAGAPARLCLLDRPLADALARPRDVRVVRTVCA